MSYSALVSIGCQLRVGSIDGADRSRSSDRGAHPGRGWVSLKLKSRRLSISAVLGLYSLTGVELEDATRLPALAYVLNLLS